jgi:hypothetical protein
MNYTKSNICGNTANGSGCGLYYKNDLNKYISNNKCINTIGYSSKTVNRDAIIFEYKNIKIANLHLEGGRFADRTINNFSEFNSMIIYKEQLLDLVIAEQPDIILGDFNSVYSSNMDQLTMFLDGQYNYFSEVILGRLLTPEEKLLINKMNSSVFEKLIASGYIYCIPSNERTHITNGRGKSIIDTIWYKEGKIKLQNIKIIDMMKSNDNYQKNICISDHNPIYAEFIINDNALINKYLKYKYLLYKKKYLQLKNYFN